MHACLSDIIRAVTTPDQEAGEQGALPVLVRATNGKSKEKRSERVKLSTIVDATALDAFYSRYAELCKAGMVALKPRDRSKKKAKARKKKGPATAAGAS